MAIVLFTMPGQLADHVDRARARYHELVQAGMDEDHARVFHLRNKDPRLPGGDDFMKMAYAKSGTRRSSLQSDQFRALPDQLVRPFPVK